MTRDGATPAQPACRECGYALGGLGTCPECGWSPGDPVSRRRVTGSLLFYYACYIPIVEAVVLAGWGIQHLLVPQGSRSITLIAIGSSLLGVMTSTVVTSLAKYNDRVFARLRWVCFVIAVAVAIGLAALAVVRPGKHMVLLYALTLLNAGAAYIALVSKGVPVSVLEPESEDPQGGETDA